MVPMNVLPPKYTGVNSLPLPRAGAATSNVGQKLQLCLHHRQGKMDILWAYGSVTSRGWKLIWINQIISLNCRLLELQTIP